MLNINSKYFQYNGKYGVNVMYTVGTACIVYCLFHTCKNVPTSLQNSRLYYKPQHTILTLTILVLNSQLLYPVHLQCANYLWETIQKCYIFGEPLVDPLRHVECFGYFPQDK